MDKVLRFTLFCGIISTVLSAATIDNTLMATQYLMYFNHIKQSDMDQGVPMSEDILVAGIRRFQNLANLTVTGEFDNATMNKMNQPRCGVGDMMFNIDAARKRRFAARKPWPMTTLTWRIDNFTPDFGTPAIITEIMSDSFDFWANASSLTFNQVPANDSSANITISFATFSHGDGNPFDGPGGILAHAYFPGNGIGGDAHFDESETFAAAEGEVNLLQVAVHEFGHSLGLGHSEVDAAVMAPFYTGYDPNFALHPDDIAGIQNLYGENVGSLELTMSLEEILSHVCTGQFDTITRTSDGGTYAFKGNMVFKLDNNATGLESGFPTEISSVFAGLPNDLDASVFFEDVGKTYFFKGSQYYQVSGTTLDSGYPRFISAKWNGLPNDLDAGFVWSGNGRVYFIKGNQYYRYNRYSEAVDAGYPRPLSVWRGLPASVESAMQWSNSRTYFFSGEEYYRFNDRSFRVDTSYPRSTVQYWIGCELDDLQQAATPTSGSNTFYMSSLAVIMFSSLISLQLVK